MALAAPLKKLFYHTVTIAPRSSMDKYGKPTYGTAVSYSAKIEQSERAHTTDLGQQITGRYRIFLDTTSIPDINGQLTMPSGFSPTNPAMLSVSPVNDHNGINHIVIETGVKVAGSRGG